MIRVASPIFARGNTAVSRVGCSRDQ